MSVVKQNHTIIRLQGYILAAVALLTVILSVQGCLVSTAMRGRPGVDTSEIRVGYDRIRVEAIVGKPDREWKSLVGVTYCLYKFDGGVPPSISGAALFSIMDIATLGILEYSQANHPASADVLSGPAISKRLIISYDDMGQVLGIFDESATLPPDGKPRL